MTLEDKSWVVAAVASLHFSQRDSIVDSAQKLINARMDGRGVASIILSLADISPLYRIEILRRVQDAEFGEKALQEFLWSSDGTSYKSSFCLGGIDREEVCHA